MFITKTPTENWALFCDISFVRKKRIFWEWNTTTEFLLKFRNRWIRNCQKFCQNQPYLTWKSTHFRLSLQRQLKMVSQPKRLEMIACAGWLYQHHGESDCSKQLVNVADSIILMREALLPLEILFTLITDGDPRHLIRISKSLYIGGYEVKL